MRYVAIISLAVLIGCHGSSRPSASSDGGPLDGPGHSDRLPSDRLEKDAVSLVGHACISSETCGSAAWCNPGPGVCQLRGTPKVSFSRAVNPLFHNDSCDSCHAAVGDIGAVTGTSGTPLIFSQANPSQSWRALVSGGTNCADGLSRRICVDDPRKSLLALFPLRIPGQPPFDSTQIVNAFTSWSDPDLQTFLGWIAEGAPFDGPDGGPNDDAGPIDARTLDATQSDARPSDARTSDGPPSAVDAGVDMPGPRTNPLGPVGPLVFSTGVGCYVEQVSWTAATDDLSLAAGVSYDVCDATGPSDCASAASGTHQTVVGATRATLSAPGPGTYFVVVGAGDAAGDQATPATDSFTLAAIPPDAPGGLSALPSPGAPTTLTASWSPPQGGCTPAAGYEICAAVTNDGCGQGGSGAWTTAVSTTGTSVALTGLNQTTTYYVFVRSVAQDGTSVSAAAVAAATTGTLPDTTPPVAVGGVTVAAGASCHAVTVSWTPPTDDRSTASQISYDVCYSTSASLCNSDPTSASHLSVAAGVTSTSVPGLNVATLYYFTVRGIDAANNENSQPATPTSFTIQPNPLVAPTGLVAALNGSSATSLSLSWTAGVLSDCTVVSGYEVCGSTSGACGAGGPWSAPAAGASAVVSGLTPNTPYYLSVRAVDGQGNASSVASTAAPTTTLCSFATNIVPFLNTSCNGSTCHASVLPMPITYANLAATTSAPNCNVDIVPSAPAQSAIYVLTQPSPCGGKHVQMTPTGYGIIGTWINQGALNN